MQSASDYLLVIPGTRHPASSAGFLMYCGTRHPASSPGTRHQKRHKLTVLGILKSAFNSLGFYYGCSQSFADSRFNYHG